MIADVITASHSLHRVVEFEYHQTLAMDAQTVAETLRVVLTGRGAR